MEKTKVGEYGRTNLGNIIKFVWFQEDGVTCKNKVVLVDEMIKSSRPFYYFKKNEFIKNHSKNIIDLVEVGDYVNGALAYEILDNEIETLDGKIKVKRIHVTTGFLLYEKDIKSIVTKEQFANTEYRLED